MQKFFVLLITLAIGVVGVSLPVAAADGPVTVTDATVLPAKQSLVINAPQFVQVGEHVRIQITEKLTGKPISGVGLWAVSFRNGPSVTAVADIQALQETGIFLGWSGNNGEVSGVFKELGWYLLIAVKDGYLPGFAWIDVQQVKQLVIGAPESAGIGEPMTITVYAQSDIPTVASFAPVVVPEAAVWALTYDNTALVSQSDESLATDAQKRGIFLGLTNKKGQVYHKFEKEGRYLLVAIKDGYKPGLRKILIYGELKELVIRAPEVVKILEPVTIRVVEKSILTVEIPVPKVGVWAISVNSITAEAVAEDEITAYQKRGIFLGYTDEKGYVNPPPQFKQAGIYRLIAIKEGYKPGYGKITVKGPVISTAVPIPQLKINAPTNATITKKAAIAGSRVMTEINGVTTAEIKATR